jgi:hypothetical protein
LQLVAADGQGTRRQERAEIDRERFVDNRQVGM